jgi:hypothetical protein
MGFDASKVVRDEDPDKEVSAAELKRAFEPIRKSIEQFREATRSLGGVETMESFLEQQRRQYRDLARDLVGFDQTRKNIADLGRLAAAASDAQVSAIARQVREAVATHNAPATEANRRVLEAMQAHLVSVRLTQVEALRPSPTPVIARIPYRPQPTSKPVGEVITSPPSEPPGAVGEREQAEQFAVTVLAEVVGGLLLIAIVWYMRTGVWVFEQLLAYYIQQLK